MQSSLPRASYVPLFNHKPVKITTGGHYAHVERDFYEVGDRRIFFRSKMEANYALYLEFLKKRGDILQWEYEPKTFVFDKILFGTRSYKPDFRVVRKNGSVEWHETKGFMNQKSKTKLKRMEKYFPNEKIIVIDNDQYRALSKWRSLLHWY